MKVNLFEKAYKSLNPEQKRAVDAIEGPVMVITGPGTGKTTILTLRIANILKKTDTRPENILALTFTESAAGAMRHKLAEIIGPEAYRVNISTFHSFASRIISEFPDEFQVIGHSRHVHDFEAIEIMQRILTDGDFKHVRPAYDTYSYVTKLVGAIKTLKREDTSPKEYSNFVKKIEKGALNAADLRHENGKYKGKIKGAYHTLLSKIERSKELALVYQKYSDILRDKKLIDFEDLLMGMVSVLKDKTNLRRELQERYQYILADEHQDANAAQNHILELLAEYHDNPNLFIVGDEKQAIYRFQGASLENFRYFQKLYPASILIALTHNYRSHQLILDASAELSKKATQLSMDKLIGRQDDKKPVDLFVFETRIAEARGIAQSVVNLRNLGADLSEIAVLYRNNNEASIFQEALTDEGILSIVHSSIDFYANNRVRGFLSLLHSIGDLADNEALARVLLLDFLSLPTSDIYILFEYARKTRHNLIGIISSQSKLSDAKIPEPYFFIDISRKLSSWSRIFTNDEAASAIQRISRESGFIAKLLRKEDGDAISLWGGFISEVEKARERQSGITLSEFFQSLRTLEAHSIKVDRSSFEKIPHRVNLLTAHRSKGLEFDHVFVTGLTDSNWGGGKDRNYFLLPYSGDDRKGANTDDDRRLLYVSITRARKHATLSYARNSADGKGIDPSRFIYEIDPGLLRKCDSEKESERAPKADLSPKPLPILRDKEVLRRMLMSRNFSVSALNNYLKCPWRYFFINLILFPQIPDSAALYGTAIHGALRDAYERHRVGKKIRPSELLRFFETQLERTYMGDVSYKAYLDKGNKALAVYHGEILKSPKNILNDVDIRDVTLNLKDIPSPISFVGIFDKVIFHDETRISIVDYKTGKPKTRNELLGLTKHSDGNYYRQLCYYKMLVEKTKKHSWVMEEGIIEFVEPDEIGRIHREEFMLGHDEAREIEALTRDTIKQIYNLDFWDKSCNQKDCEWCRLSEALR